MMIKVVVVMVCNMCNDNGGTSSGDEGCHGGWF